MDSVNSQSGDAHPSVEMLEEYAFKRLPEAATESVEEHLLLCGACQNKLREVDEYILLMKQATAARLVKPPLPASHWVGAMTVLAAIGIAVFLGLHRPEPVGPPQRVELVAFRGDDMAHAGAGRPIDLVIDAADLPGSSEYRIELVNASGQLISKGPAVGEGGRLCAHVTSGIKRGVYWVRLFTSAGVPLREFGLRAD